MTSSLYLTNQPREYNTKAHSLSNSGNNCPNTRFRSLSRSNSRPRFGNFNQPIACYYCHCMGHTANNCFRCQNRNFPCKQPNQGRKFILELLNDTQTTEQILDTEMIMLLSAELISQNHQCILIYRQGIRSKH